MQRVDRRSAGLCDLMGEVRDSGLEGGDTVSKSSVQRRLRAIVGVKEAKVTGKCLAESFSDCRV